MAGPALVVRVAATIAELKANLAEGKNQIEITQSALVKMAASYDGSKIIQQAGATAAAIQQIGGAANLTAAEQAKANAILEAALDKYRALGREAPPGMKALADETKQANTQHTELLGTVKNIVVGFAAMFTARAAINFINETIQQASALKDLSNQTHISVEELQTLAGSMSEFGVDADTLGKGLFKLSRGIAGGDESVVQGLHLMGMSLKDVEGLNGQALFLKIEHGLSTLQGGLRDTAAADLFGGKLGAAMAGASEGIDGALASWKAMNTVASTESVEALDKYGEAIDRTEASLTAMATNMMGPVAEGFNVVTGASEKGATKMQIFWAVLKDWNAGGTFGANTENLATLLDHLNQRTQAATTVVGERTAALTQQQKVEQFMAALERDAAVALDAEQLRHLDHLKDIHALTAKNAEAVGVNANQFEGYKAALVTSEAAAKKLKDATEEISSAGVGWQGTLAGINGETAAAVRYYLEAGVSQNALATAYGLTATQVKSVATFMTEQIAIGKKADQGILETIRIWDEYDTIRTKQSGTSTDVQIAQVKRWADDLTARVHKAGADTTEFYEALAATSQAKVDDILVDWAAVSANSSEIYQKTLQQAADKAEATFNFMAANSDNFSAKTINHFQDVAISARNAANEWASSFESAGDKAVDSVEKVKKAVSGISAGWSGTAGSVIDPTAMAALSFAGLLDSRGQFTGTADQFHAVMASLPGRAGGGGVAAGQPYTVGERGPEVFIPSSAGTIVPNGGGGTSLTIAPGAIQINYPLMNDPRARYEIAQLIGETLMTRLRASGFRAPSGA